MLGYKLILQNILRFNTFSTGPVQTGYDRFLAVFFGPGPGLLISGNSQDRTGPRSIQYRAKNRDRTGL